MHFHLPILLGEVHARRSSGVATARWGVEQAGATVAFGNLVAASGDRTFACRNVVAAVASTVERCEVLRRMGPAAVVSEVWCCH
jgi:hypothetical protein